MEIRDMVKFVLVQGAPFVKGTFFIGTIVAELSRNVWLIEPSESFKERFPQRVRKDGTMSIEKACCQLHSSKARLEENLRLLELAGQSKQRRRQKPRKAHSWCWKP
jgi:hypothetical protein